MEARNEERNDGGEVILEVPKDLALFSLGFSIDAGGSVTKLLYRSKEDYRNGKRLTNVESEDGVLRMRYFRRRDDEALVNFLRDHCDLMESAMEADGWFQTGVHLQRFKHQLEDVLKIKVKTLSEPEAIYKAMRGFYSQVPDCRPLGLAPEAVDNALKTVRGFLQMMEHSQRIGEETFGEILTKTDPETALQYTKKLMTIDGTTLAQELNQFDIKWPMLTVNTGSADAMMLINEDGKMDFGNFSGVCGLSFLGLGKVLCGAKDFDELIEMASRGDHRKVDVLAGDMKVRDRSEEDWYSVMPEDVVIFSMGKLAEDTYIGKYTKEDLAAGLLHLIASVIAKIAFGTARMAKAQCVAFVGSLVSRQVVREAVQKWILEDTLFQPLAGEEPVKWLFLPHPGFVCAFGVWYHNWLLEQERRANHIS